MAKRPTPKKRRAKSAGRSQYSMYVSKQTKRLTKRRASPYATVAKSSKGKGGDGSKGITKIKA
jgi:hypothetical protein